VTIVRQYRFFAVAVAVASCAGLHALLDPVARAADAGATPALEIESPYRLAGLPPPGLELPALPGLSALGSRSEFLFTLPATFSFDSVTGINADNLGSVLDRPRATVRYTWFSHPGWEMKIGLSTTLEPGNTWQRFLSPSSDRLRVSALPTMHLAGEGQLADNWLVSLSAEGMRSQRSQGIDMDFRVDYRLKPNMALFGSYRMIDSTRDGQDIYGFLPSNSARFGVRLRF